MTERTLSTIPAPHLLLALRRRRPAPLQVRTLTPQDLRQASAPVLDRLPLGVMIEADYMIDQLRSAYCEPVPMDRWHETVSYPEVKGAK